MQSQFLFETDWLHLNAKGYETMGGCIDLDLFTKTDALAADDEEDEAYGEALWIEAEDYIYARVLCPTWDDDSYWVGVVSRQWGRL